MSVGLAHQRPRLTLFYNNNIRAHLQDFFGGLYQVGLGGEQAGFLFVDYEAVDPAQQLFEVGELVLYPAVHSVGGDENGRVNLLEQLELQGWGGVGKKNVSAVPVFFRNCRFYLYRFCQIFKSRWDGIWRLVVNLKND